MRCHDTQPSVTISSPEFARLRAVAAWRLVLALMAWLCLPAIEVRAQAETVTRNNIDGVQIYRVTPRVLSDIPVPAKLNYTFDLKVLLRSTETGTVQVRFERCKVSGQNRVAVAPTIDRSISGKKGQHLLLQSGPISIDKAEPGERLVVTATLKDAKGREVSYSSCYNRLAGTVKLRPSSASPVMDRVELLGTSPSAGSVVPVGVNTDFTVRFYYSVRSTALAYASLEFGDLAEVKRGACWFSATIPLQRGCGTAEVRLSHFFPSFTAGQSMAIALPLRIKPLDSSVMFVEVHPFSLEAPTP